MKHEQLPKVQTSITEWLQQFTHKQASHSQWWSGFDTGHINIRNFYKAYETCISKNYKYNTYCTITQLTSKHSNIVSYLRSGCCKGNCLMNPFKNSKFKRGNVLLHTQTHTHKNICYIITMPCLFRLNTVIKTCCVFPKHSLCTKNI